MFADSQTTSIMKWIGIMLVAAGLAASVAATEAQGPPDILWKQAAHGAQTSGIAFSPDGALVATGSYTQGIKLWKASDGTPIRTLAGYGAHVCFSPDGRTLAAAGGTAITLWRVSDGALQETIHEFDHDITVLAYSPDGTVLGAADQWSSTKIIDIATGEVLHDLPAYSDAVAFSFDGQLLAGGGQNGWVRVWRVSDGQLVQLMGYGYPQTVQSLAFVPPRGEVLASGGSAIQDEFEGTVNFWRVSDGALVHSLRNAHAEIINTIALSPDGRFLATGARDATLKLWNAGDYSELRKYDEETGNVAYWPYSGPRTVQFAAGGNEYGFGRDDGWVVVADNPFECNMREAMSAVCKPGAEGRYTFIVRLKKGTPGALYPMCLDGGDCREFRTNDRGKLKVKYAGVSAGTHSATLRWCRLGASAECL
ncbi:MAG: WD40 repeat domain-containing protein [Phycisphaerales bacterium]|nr:WD40 repeat domain-containing protein [Phycisphaerales bacterium]